MPPLSARELEPRAEPDIETDAVYGLVSVLYHALQNASACRKYVADARAASNPALEQFFEQCRASHAEHIEAAKRLLAPLIATAADARAVSAEPTAATSAAFAPGDGADDADISATAERGRVGNWPAL